MDKTVYIAIGNGCPRAKVDTSSLSGYFDANGWKVTSAIEDAELVVVAACGVDEASEGYGVSLLEEADRKRAADSRLVITGCIASISEEVLADRFDAELIAPRDLARFDEMITASVPLHEVADANRVDPVIAEASRLLEHEQRALPKRVAAVVEESGIRGALTRYRARMKSSEVHLGAEAPQLYDIRVAKGCLGHCTYCAIRAACGPLWSKPLDDVVTELKTGLDRGYTDFRIVAQDVGAYGQDIGSDVAELFEALFAVPGDFHVTILDLDTNFFIRYQDRLIRVFADNASRIRSLAIPLQSGSDRVLELMKRGHNGSDAVAAVHRLREAAPHLKITTHAMVGFPGETDEDFAATQRALRESGFSRVDVYEYGDRPRTPASRMTPKVPAKTIRSRARRIRGEFAPSDG